MKRRRGGVVEQSGGEDAENDRHGLAKARGKYDREQLRLVANLGDGDDGGGNSDGLEHRAIQGAALSTTTRRLRAPKTAEGVDMVKRLRQNLIAQGRERLCEQVADLIGAKITALFTDIDTVVGERIFVFTLESDLEANFR